MKNKPGDSQEEVMIFRYTHTLHHNIYIITLTCLLDQMAIIIIIIITSTCLLDQMVIY